MQEANRLACTKADLVITPKLGDHLSSDFSDLDSLIAIGELATEESLPTLKRLIGEQTLQRYPTDYAIQYERPQFSWTSELSSVYQDSLCDVREARLGNKVGSL